MGEFNVLDAVMDEVRLCKGMDIQITKIILGIKALAGVWERQFVTDSNPALTRSPEPNTFQAFLLGIPVKIVEGGNPWAIGFERKPIERN
jgi:hypothetical protein